jgi:DNA-binding SARP family transcriptional activator
MLATLESCVCVLRRTLSLGRGRTAALATMNRCYVLDDAQVSVDIVEVRHALGSADPHEVARAVGRTDGELLATEPYAGWANQARWTFQERLVDRCTAAAATAGAAGDDGPAVQLARAAVMQPCFSERARQELIKALFRSGERAQALTVYAELRRQMVEELGRLLLSPLFAGDRPLSEARSG